MEQLIRKVLDTITNAGLVEVEVSARHVHLTQEDVEKLFGKGQVLHEKRPLSQKGQYLSEERVTLIQPKGKRNGWQCLACTEGDSGGAFRKRLRGTGSTGASSGIRRCEGLCSYDYRGTAGRIAISEGTIVAHNHIHVPTEVAERLQLSDKEHVSVKILTERPVTFDDVIIRVSDAFNFKMHIDFDEANAASVKGFTLGKIIRRE